MKKTKLRPDELTIDARLQQRAKGLDPTTLAEYADAWKAGADFPPVVVFDVDGTLYVTQGFHRYESARMAGIVRLAVEVHKGTWKEARLNAAGSNGTHGLKRSNEDKQRSVGMVLEDNPTWSNAKVAEAANVSDRMVSDYRKAHPGKNDSETFGVAGGAEDENDSETFGVDPAPEVREGKDGRKYKVPAKAPKPAAPKPARREPTPAEVNARGAFPFGHEAPEAEPVEVVEDVPTPEDVSAVEEPAEVPEWRKPELIADVPTGNTLAPVPEADAKLYCQALEKVCRDLDGIKTALDELATHPLSVKNLLGGPLSRVVDARKQLWAIRPAHPCPYCRATGKGDERFCRACSGRGRVGKQTYESGRSAVGDAA